MQTRAKKISPSTFIAFSRCNFCFDGKRKAFAGALQICATGLFPTDERVIVY